MLIKLEGNDVVVGARLLRTKSEELKLENEKGTVYEVSVRRYAAASRGGKGHQLFKRGKLVGVVHDDPVLPSLGEAKSLTRPPKPN
jgi:DNA gyrase/topoisomerase IV subunit A